MSEKIHFHTTTSYACAAEEISERVQVDMAQCFTSLTHADLPTWNPPMFLFYVFRWSRDQADGAIYHLQLRM